MSNAPDLNQVLADATGKGVETLSLWADLNQKILRELVDLSASTAKEGVRLYAELQSAVVEVVNDCHAGLREAQSSLGRAPLDPISVYQRTLTASVGNAQRIFKLVEGNAQVVTRSAERLQATAEQAGRQVQASLTHLTGKLKELYSLG
jgi:hypothetical protein